MEGECPKCGRQLDTTGRCNCDSNSIHNIYHVAVETIDQKYDTVKHPAHYCKGRDIEPKDVMRSYHMNAEIGQALKYLSRAGRKGDEVEDLKKALFWIEDELEFIRNANKLFAPSLERVSGKDIIEDWDLDPAISSVVKMLLDYSEMRDGRHTCLDRMEDALASAEKILKKYLKQKE